MDVYGFGGREVVGGKGCEDIMLGCLRVPIARWATIMFNCLAGVDPLDQFSAKVFMSETEGMASLVTNSSPENRFFGFHSEAPQLHCRFARRFLQNISSDA